MDAPPDPSSQPPAPIPPSSPPPTLPAPAPAAPLPPAVPTLPITTPAYIPAVPEALKHSGVGIASVVLAGLVAVALLITFIIAGVLHGQHRGPRDPATMMVGLLTIALMGGDVVALGLGVASLFQRDRKKLFGIIGVICSGLMLLGTVGIVLLGLAMARRAG